MSTSSSSAGTGPLGPTPPSDLASRPEGAGGLDLDACLADEAASFLDVDLASGLDPAQVVDRRERFGPNLLSEPPGRSPWHRFIDQFRSLLVVMLAGAATVALLVGDVKDAAVVGVVLLVNAVLGFIQEGKAESSMAALREMLVTTCTVRRDATTKDVPAEALVPGDIVLLEPGDKVPADGRFVAAKSLALDESSLTGESLPVDKTDKASQPTAGTPSVGDRHNRGFMNTTVVRGRGTLLVTDTGMATEMGRVAGLMHETADARTPLQDQLDALGKRLAAVAAVAVGLVFVVGLAKGEPFTDALLGAVALAVAAIPEGLPAVVTVTLAVGVHQMALRRAIVKRLSSVETLGSTTVICSDKTGTLTKNEMAARTLVLDRDRYELAADGVVGAVDAGASDQIRRVLEAGIVCNEAALDDGVLVGDPTEGALLRLAVAHGVDVASVRDDRRRLAEVPFDSAAKFMATFNRWGPDVVCVVKGAPEVVLSMCTATATESEPRPFDDQGRTYWREQNEALAEDGMRVLAIASRRLPDTDAFQGTEESADPARWVENLTFEALIGIEDPPRSEVAEAIGVCGRAGVAVKMITGDHAATAAAIASQLGIDGRVVSGVELDALSDSELDATIDTIGVCARVSPDHKVRVVNALKRNGHIVAMTGDGVNDAAALRHADIGVAMGITGTEVTKGAADMVLVDDNFETIVGAVERGRAINDNIVKFVRFQLTTSLGAVATLLLASLLGLPAPLSAIQVLFINIIADGPPAMTLGVDPPSPGTMTRQPRPPGAPILDRARIIRLGYSATVMVVGTLGVLVAARDRWGDEVALTMAFTTFVGFQLANVFNARTESASILSRHSLVNAKLWAAVGTVAALQILIVTVTPFQDLFATTALSGAQWAICIGVAVTVVLAEEARKAIARIRHRPSASTPQVFAGAERV